MTAKTDESLLLFTADKLEEKTGKGWDAWFDILDKRDATKLTHTEIAWVLYDEYNLDGWYSQGITVSYERVRGLRAKGGDRDGTYSASASKTVPVSVETLFDAWIDDKKRETWLGKGVLESRTNSLLKSARFDQLETGTILAVYFADKGPGKSTVQIEDAKLASPEEADERKALWKKRLTDLHTYLSSND